MIYSFDQSNRGIISPEGPVAFNSSGVLYGTTALGGDPNCQGGYGCGVIFQLSRFLQKNKPWTYSTVYDFKGGNDGIEPTGYMAFDSKDNLYSTTNRGGEAQGGIAFRLKPGTENSTSWTETVLHWFPKTKKDGFDPIGGLTWGKWGELYGVASEGGIGCQTGCGTVFVISP